tara:strand:- start:817 stop:993 length:177 start_codon:yes stop_codon:yes gene_type:complete
VSNSGGDQYLVEVSEVQGFVSISIGDKFRIDVSPDEAFDLVDALTIVANGLSNHLGED